MKIEIKRIEHSERMSEETNCFTADLWVDGKKIGQISNRGTGGCDDFHGDRAAYDAADEWCRANLPKWEMGGQSYNTDIEMHVADLLEAHLAAKEMKRAMGKKLLFTIPSKPGIYHIPAKAPMKPTDPRLLAHVAAKHPGATILNTMAEADALAIYRGAGA